MVVGKMRLSRDGAELRHTRRTAGKVTCLAFSSAGSLLATGSKDASITLWDAETGNVSFVCRKHQGAVWSLCFSPGGSRLASGGWDGSACIWDPWTGDLIHHLQAHKGPVWAVAYSSSGGILATGGRDERVVLWNANTGEPFEYLKYGVVHPVYCVAMNPQETLLAEGSMDNTVRLWSLGEGSGVTKKLDRSEKAAQHAATRKFRARPDQTALRAAKVKARQRKFSFFGAEAAEAQQHTEHRRASSPLGTEEPIKTLARHTAPVVSVAFSLDGTMLVSASHDHTAIIWDPASGDALHTIRSSSDSPVWCCVFSRDSSLLALGTGSGAVEFWDPSAPDTLLLRFQAHKSYIGTCAFSSDGLLLATGSDDHTFRLWSLLSPPDLLKLCRDRIEQDRRKQQIANARQREMEQLEEQRRRRSVEREKAHLQAEELYQRSVQADSSRPGFEHLRSRARSTGEPVHADDHDPEVAGRGSDEMDALNKARATALQELIRLKQRAVTRETDAVGALGAAVRDKQHELARQTRMNIHRLAIQKDADERGRLGGSVGGPPSQDAEYVDALHRRLNELYKRVGRKARGTTRTELAPEAELAPGDLERQANFQQVLLRTLEFQAYSPRTLPRY